MRKLIPLLTLVACLLPAAPAFAVATASVDGDTGVLAIQGDDSGRIIHVDANSAGTAYTVTELIPGAPPTLGAVTAGDGCTGSGHQVTCARNPDEDDFFSVEVYAEGGDDLVAVGYTVGEDVAEMIGDDWAYIEGGGGEDTIGGSANDDEIYGDLGNDRVDAAGGDDSVEGGFGFYDGVSSGSDSLFGGTGSDTLSDDDGGADVGPDVLDGGTCSSSEIPTICPGTPPAEDTADFDDVYYGDVARTDGVTVDLADETASSGASGENDSLRSMEGVFGTYHGDNLTGDASENYIYGLDGDDEIATNDGNPVDYVECGEVTENFEEVPTDLDQDTLARDYGDEHVDCESVTPPPIATPTGLTAAASGPNSIVLDWNDVTGAEGYGVFQEVPEVEGPIADDLVVSQYTVTGLLPGTTYCFSVDAGNSGEYSEGTDLACAQTTAANPDTDGDGLFGDHDQCPNVAGPAANNGCPAALPDFQQILDSVADLLGPATSGLLKGKLAGLLKKAGYQAQCEALLPGKCDQVLTFGGLASAKTVIAKGSKKMAAPGTAKYKVKLTKKGKKLLKKAKKKGKAVKATLTVRFTPDGGAAAKKSKKLKLKAPKKKKGKKKG